MLKTFIFIVMNHLTQSARTVQVVFICSSKQDPPLLSAGPREGPDLPSLSQLNLIFSRPLLLSPPSIVKMAKTKVDNEIIVTLSFHMP